MPRLYKLLTPLGAGMLVVAANGFFELAESHWRRALHVGRGSEAVFTRDEVDVLALIAKSDWYRARAGEPKAGDITGPSLLMAAVQMVRYQVANEFE